MKGREKNSKLALETNGELDVCSDFSVNLYESLGEDCGDFTSNESILETTAEEDGEGEGFTEFVGTWRGTGSLNVVKEMS
jgi:hypothetical protein